MRTNILSIFFLLFLSTTALAQGPVTLFVSPDGNDSWTGRLQQPNASNTDGPLATLDGARLTIRELTPRPAAGVIVIVAEGRYELSEGIRFVEQDGGTATAPILYRAEKPGSVILSGGKILRGPETLNDHDAISRIPTEAHDHVVQYDLRTMGITDYGELTVRGFSRPKQNAALELVCNDRPLTLARWPNDEWATITSVPGDSDDGAFVFDSPRPQRWSDLDAVWLHGLWLHDWADSTVQIEHLNTETGLITTKEPHGVYGYREGKRFFAFNILEELDQPGEWFLDRERGLLFVWPPRPIEECQMEVTLLEDPLLHLDNTRHISFEGITLQSARGNGIEVQNSSRVRVAGCTLRNLGNKAIVVDGGQRNLVQSCTIHDVGEGGIALTGGNRTTLTPAAHEAINNHIYRYSNAVITYSAAIALHGVGNRMAHNRIHDGPHTAVLFWGNDHTLEYNELFNLCKETGDVGAFYIGRDWTQRGHMVRHNFIHDIYGPYSWGAKGVYLDDAQSGVSIVGNIFYNAHEGAFVGGGRDNLVENNLFIGCDPAMHVDARGLGWAKEHIAPDGGWNMYGKLENVNHDEPPYSERYPGLATILTEQPHHPMGNTVARNVSYGGTWLRLQNVEEEWVTFVENWVSEDNDRDWEITGFELPDDHPAFENGFVRIPLEKIGLQIDRYRNEVPKNKLLP